MQYLNNAWGCLSRVAEQAHEVVDSEYAQNKKTVQDIIEVVHPISVIGITVSLTLATLGAIGYFSTGAATFTALILSAGLGCLSYDLFMACVNVKAILADTLTYKAIFLINNDAGLKMAANKVLEGTVLLKPLLENLSR